MKILAQIIIFLSLAAAVVVPQTKVSTGDFSSYQMSAVRRSSISLAVVAKASSMLVVHDASAVKTIVTALGARCLGQGANLSSSLVQDQAAINLNEPATCYSLSVNSARAVSENLQVEPLAGPAVAITLPVASYSAVGLLPAIPSAAQATIPLTGFATLLFFGLFAEKKFRDVRLQSSETVFSLTPSIYELQVMRC